MSEATDGPAGRLDSIVNPGTYSAHVHRVFGGESLFLIINPAKAVYRKQLQPFGAFQEPLTTIRGHKGFPLHQLFSSAGDKCSHHGRLTHAPPQVDNSNYWTADLYYK